MQQIYTTTDNDWKELKPPWLPGILKHDIPNSVGKDWDSQIVCYLIVSWLSLENANRTRLQKLVQEALTGYQALSSIQQMVKDF